MALTPAKVMLQKEFQTLKRCPVSEDYYVHELQNDNLFEWIVYLFGPSGTCFAGGSFKALMRFPANYPHEPPSLQFLSSVFHPNVFRDGKLCISTLQVPHPEATAEESKVNWSAVLGVSGALQSVVSLLADPNPDDPANTDAATMFLSRRDAFNRKAQECSVKSKQDLPIGFVKPILTSPASQMRREDSVASSQASKHLRKSAYNEDDDYTYDTDEQLELDEQQAMEDQIEEEEEEEDEEVTFIEAPASRVGVQ